MIRLILILSMMALLLFAGCSDNKKSSQEDSSQSSQVTTAEDATELWQEGIKQFGKGVTTDDQAAGLEGIDLLEQAVEKNPENRAAWVDLADAYIYTKNGLLVADAITICEALLKDEKSQSDLLYERIADAYLLLDNKEAALAIAQKRVEVAPEDRLSPAVLQMAIIAGQCDDITSAIRCLENRSKTTAKPGFIYVMLASLYELDGQIAKAKESLKSAIKVLPQNNPTAAKAKSELRRLES